MHLLIERRSKNPRFFVFTSKHRTIKRLVIDGAIAGQMNVSELARICDLSRPTVYKYLKMVG